MGLKVFWFKLKKYMKKLYVTGWLFRKLKGLRWMAAGIMAVSAVSSLLSIWFALYTRNVVDDAVGGNAQQLKTDVLLLIGLIVAMLLCTALSSWWEERLNQCLNRKLRKYYFERVLDGEYETVTQYHSGDLLNRITNDVSNLCQGLTQILTSLVTSVTALLAASVALWKFSPQIMFILLGIAALLCFLLFFTRQYVTALGTRISEANGRVISFFQEMINKLIIVKALDAIPHVKRRSDSLLDAHLQTQRKRTLFSVSVDTGFSLIGYAISFAALCWSASRILTGQITYGDMTAITQLAFKVEIPFYAIPTLLLKYFGMMASGERLQVLEKFPVTPENENIDIERLYQDMDGISAEGLCYAYQNDKPVLNNVTFTIPKQGITVITGTSGIGKSTLLKLMMGLYKPTKGDIFLSGENCVSLGRDTHRLFSYAPQGNLLISGTIRDNLLLVRPDAAEDELNRAVYISDMDAVLQDLPAGLDTVLGENGAGLSEGQAQRLSLARAILSPSPVLLLDEITSSLDEEAEQRVLKRLRMLENRTCIVVTHRRTVLSLADYRLHLTENSAQILSLQHTGETI